MNEFGPVVVIADDLSGAAELAGAAATHGLKAEVQTVFTPGITAELVAIDSDTRSLAAEEARSKVEEITRHLASLRPAWIYKKCDSVLRGNVLAEIRGIMAGTGKERAVLISANPSRNRVIRNGIYYVDGIPLAETAFADDPEHPRRTSLINELLGQELSGIDVPDIETETDLVRAAEHLDEFTLSAGGVDFFNAILRLKRPRGVIRHVVTAPSRAVLFVCGSAAAWNARREQEFLARGLPVLPMPSALFENEFDQDCLVPWAAAVVHGLRESPVVLMGIGNAAPPRVPGSELGNRLAHAVQIILRDYPVNRVYVEGGATAAACVRALGYTRFQAHPSPVLGVGALEPLDHLGQILFIKPGSYDWPAHFISF